jgi:hypothetical protein
MLVVEEQKPNTSELFKVYDPIALRDGLDALLYDYAMLVLEKEDITHRGQQDNLALIKTLRDTLGERSPVKQN